jgi:hypothetical protein
MLDVLCVCDHMAEHSCFGADAVLPCFRMLGSTLTVRRGHQARDHRALNASQPEGGIVSHRSPICNVCSSHQLNRPRAHQHLLLTQPLNGSPKQYGACNTAALVQPQCSA